MFRGAGMTYARDVQSMNLEDQEKYLEKKYNESQRATDSWAEQLKVIRLMKHSAKSDIVESE